MHISTTSLDDVMATRRPESGKPKAGTVAIVVDRSVDRTTLERIKYRFYQGRFTTTAFRVEKCRDNQLVRVDDETRVLVLNPDHAAKYDYVDYCRVEDGKVLHMSCEGDKVGEALEAARKKQERRRTAQAQTA